MSTSSGPKTTRPSNGGLVAQDRPNGKPFGELDLEDLPFETQEQIIRHVARKELFTLQRVSPHFFFLATAELYRDLNLNITNSGDEDHGLPKSHAADALQTILASEHDYGRHIRSLRIGAAEDSVELSTSSSLRQDPLLMTRLMWDSKSDSSKFLNTTLLLVARKATILETFQWDAPIELSGAVYQALHKLTSLRHLRVRLDVTPSPKMVIRHGLPPSSHPPPPHHHAQAVPTPSQFIPPATGPSQGTSGSHPIPASSKANNVKRKKVGGGGYNYWANSRTFSGFKTLTSLALMGMANLECLGEISECIKASSGTLNSLTLSLSTDLARKARKPVAVNPELDDPSDTELDEDEMMNDPMPPSTSTVQPVTNEADIRKEKLAQESILARIFDLQSVSAEGKKLEKTLSLAGGQYIEEQLRRNKSQKLNALVKSLMDTHELDASSTPARLEHFKMVREIADLYINSHMGPKKLVKEQIKPAIPPVKNESTASQASLQPITNLEPSSSSSQIPNLMDWDLGPLSSPTSPLFGPGSSNSQSNGQTVMPKDKAQAASLQTQMQKMKELKAQQHHAMVLASQSHLPAMLSSAQQSQSLYTSPYLLGPYAPPSLTSTHLPLPHENSHSSSPSSLDGPSAIMYNSYPSTNTGQNPSFNIPSNSLNEGAVSPKIQNGIPSAIKKGKFKATVPQESGPAKIVHEGDSDDDFDTPRKSPLPTGKPFFVADSSAGEPIEDSMDIDMEHPDEDTTDLGEDQETVAGAEEVEAATPRKKAKIAKAEPGDSIDAAGKESSPSALIDKTPVPEATISDPISPEEAMQAYIRANHGLHLEELSLEWVPLKASIVARALDLSVLKRITLLEVGSQDAFWTLLVRLQKTAVLIAFKSIHTDNVSLPFMEFLATFEGLEELFMHERGGKQDAEPVAGTVVNIGVIRKLALKKHISTLKRLMIRNESKETWDVDNDTLQFLAFRGAKLIELAVSLNMKTYHTLMQLLARFKKLYALHLVNLRSTDRNPVLQNESLNFAVDSLSHCRDMKIKYIALINQVIAIESRPAQWFKALNAVLEQRAKDKKGKGKATADPFGIFLDAINDSESEDNIDGLAEIMAGESKVRYATNFASVKDVKIFSKEIRGGKL